MLRINKSIVTMKKKKLHCYVSQPSSFRWAMITPTHVLVERTLLIIYRNN
jgi:hypothetical protein